MASHIINAVTLLLLWGIGFLSMRSSLAPIPFLCRHLQTSPSTNWSGILSFCMVQGIFMYFGIYCSSRRSITQLSLCATHRAVPVRLSCFHIEGNLLSRKAIWELFGHAFKIDISIYIYIYIYNNSLGFEITVMVENGLARETWIWMTSNIRRFESRLVHYSQELTVQS